ncbi:hypothetical protein [Candidatus Pelagibacter sp. Uisw_113]|uniref:hypothetical protein n=1 Tax=Candidatus Pelagibacter sp. Uisw_113 TaxID=3230994 RepID=UPI0039EA2919
MINKVYIIIESIERFNFWNRLKEIKNLKVLTIKESVYIACRKNDIHCIKLDYQKVNLNKISISKKLKKNTYDVKNDYLRKKTLISLILQLKNLKIDKKIIIISWSDTNLLLNCLKHVYSKNRYIHLEIANINGYLFVDRKGVNRNSELYQILKKTSISNKIKKIPNKLYIKRLKLNSLYTFYDFIDYIIGKSFYSIKFFIYIFSNNFFSLLNSYLIKMISNNNNTKANTLIIGQLSKDWNMSQYNMTNIKIIKYFIKNKKDGDVGVFKPHPKELSVANIIELYLFCRKKKIFFSSKYSYKAINKIYTHTSSHVYNFINTKKKVIFISDSLPKQIYNKGLSKKIIKKYCLKINYYSNEHFNLNIITSVI